MALLRSQKTGCDCGPTCFANTLNILGYDIKIEQANRLCRLRKEGTDSGDLSVAFDRYGFEINEKIHYSSKGAWNWLIKSTNLGVPVIISTDYDSHWLLVLLAGKNKAQIFDPEDSLPKLVSRKDLIQRWSHTPDKNSKIIFHSLEIIPYKDKSVRAVIIRQELIKTMDVK
jgi:ABC-type bacteriocin/lantibiotic exporter with double-glycine peptidase domain